MRYWYKPEGGRHAAVRGAGSVGFTTIFYYDGLQRPIAAYNDLPTPGNDVNVGLAYNPASQIVSRSMDNDSYAAPPAYNVARGYQANGLNQYSGTTVGGAPNWSYEYDPNGNLKRVLHVRQSSEPQMRPTITTTPQPVRLTHPNGVQFGCGYAAPGPLRARRGVRFRLWSGRADRPGPSRLRAAARQGSPV